MQRCCNLPASALCACDWHRCICASRDHETRRHGGSPVGDLLPSARAWPRLRRPALGLRHHPSGSAMPPDTKTASAVHEIARKPKGSGSPLFESRLRGTRKRTKAKGVWQPTVRKLPPRFTKSHERKRRQLAHCSTTAFGYAQKLTSSPSLLPVSRR